MEIKKRFDRIVGIFIHLQAKSVVTAQELASRFDVSLRTIYRDIRSLEQAGVPIYSEAGVGYSLVDGYKIPPTLFTREEALSFVAAEKIMQVYVGKELSDDFNSALFKMKAILRTSQKSDVSIVSPAILVKPEVDLFNKAVPTVLSVLFTSILTKKQIEINYLSGTATEISLRIVEPIGVFYESCNWYFMAYCHLRKAVRQFRSDRVQSIVSLDQPFELKHDVLETYLSTKTSDESKITVRILVEKWMVTHLIWERKYYGFLEEIERGEQIEMVFKVTDFSNGFARWFLMFADVAEIIEPLELRSYVDDLLNKIMTKQKK